MKKTTKYIGTLSGKILIFGGVYSNFQALEKLITIAQSQSILPQNIICTGDIVGYCATPEDCLETIKNWGIHTVLGNVEIQLRDDADDCGCNFNTNSRCDIFSKQWFPFAQKNTSAASKQWLETLPDYLTFEYAEKRCLVVHGDYFETSGYVFRSTDWAIKQANFEASQVDVILGGHCGLPFASVQENKFWLNAGVIGMPANDATTRVWYMLLNDSPFSFEHHFFDYDFQQAADLMIKNGLPKAYSNTLTTGLWDNCEILPPIETAEQGQFLNF